KSDPAWPEGPLPEWTTRFLLKKGQSIRDVKYLLTFRPFGQLSPSVQQAYLAGELHLLPFPGSLIFWGSPAYLKLRDQEPLATQVPLQHLVNRNEGPRGIRVPQSGWLHEEKPGGPGFSDFAGPVRNTFKRTHKQAKVLRHQDELALTDREEKVTHVLFSSSAEDVGLYGKPMACNAQLVTSEFQILLDGPNATPAELDQALHTIEQ